MKKALITIVWLSIGLLSSYAQQTKAHETSKIANDSVLTQYLDAYLAQLREPQYKLYPTENT